MTLHRVHTGELKGHRLEQPVRTHIGRWIKNPDPGSNFDKKTRLFRWLPIRILTAILFTAGYEGIVFLDEENTVVGHVFYQRHGDALHAFHWFIEPEHRGHKYMTEISNAFFEHARENPAVVNIRIGAGGNERIARLWETIRDGDIIPTCGLKAGDKMGWLFFPERLAH